MTVGLMLHLCPEVPVRVTLHPDADRAVVTVGTSTLLLDLFVQRGELLALRDALAAAVVDLDTARTDSTAEQDETGPRGTSSGDEVDTPAA
jgi:hypothetical protein